MLITSNFSSEIPVLANKQPSTSLDLDVKVSEVFNVQVLKSGSINMKPSKDVGNIKSCIYAIWNIKTKMIYIGKTDQMFKKRLSQHAYCANHPDLDAGKSKFYQLLHNDPANFRFGLVKHNTKTRWDPQNLSKIEKEEIEKIPASLRLNSNTGGGGGTSPKVVKVQKVFDKSKVEIFNTPKKYYPLKVKSKKVAFDLTPGIALAQDAVYVIKNRANGKRYVGYTSQLVKDRLAQHASQSNRKRGLFSGQTIYQAMQANPQQFEAGILAKNISSEKLPKLEKELIFKKRAFTDGYNCNQGGGGSIATKKLKTN
jgi:predicted GIY-YIG superfamily endonuclease